MRVVAIIQARMGSTRLPGKVLMELHGEPMLARVVERTRRARTVDQVVVATTTLEPDGSIVRLCEERGWPVFRGSEDDVLDRYYQAAVEHAADVVVRITSDCPLIDPEIIDLVAGEFQAQSPGVDYAGNSLETFPRGLDVEVVGFEALARAWRECSARALRENVTPYIIRQPGIFRAISVNNDFDFSEMRWTVDTAEDLAFVRAVYERFTDDRFGYRDVVRVLSAEPRLLEINRHVRQKPV